MTSINASKILRKADSFLQHEKPNQAAVLLKSYLNDHDDDQVWRKLVRVYWILGDDVCARAILRSIVPKLPSPNPIEIVAARIPYVRPLVIDEAMLIYYNIPKSGSSTIMLAILQAAGFYFPIRNAHMTAGSSYGRLLSFSTIDDKYSHYDSFAVLRHPVERLRSYWKMNVIAKKQLVDATGGRSSFYGLNTLPSYEEILLNFHRYRQVFQNFRHHTECSQGLMGNNRDRIRYLFKFPDVDSAVALIGTAFGKPLPRIHKLKSTSEVPKIAGSDLEMKVVEDFYKDELKLFFSS